MPQNLFIFGLGYTAVALAERLLAAGWQVSGTCRSADKCREFSQTGIRAHVFDGIRPLDPTVFDGTSHILVSTPPGPDGDPVFWLHGSDIATLSGLEWFGYLSTTGVYGNKDGDWVDEDTPVAPTTERGRRRVRAENAWLGLWRNDKIPVHIFRLAGIYGPGRNQLETVMAGSARRIIKKGQVFSRIHRDDIVSVLRASMAAPDPGTIYNVCDDEAAPPQDVLSYACSLLNKPEPPAIPFDEADLSPMARSFYAENKRVHNNRIKRDLGVVLQYPNYCDGLKALLGTFSKQ